MRDADTRSALLTDDEAPAVLTGVMQSIVSQLLLWYSGALTRTEFVHRNRPHNRVTSAVQSMPHSLDTNRSAGWGVGARTASSRALL